MFDTLLDWLGGSTAQLLFSVHPLSWGEIMAAIFSGGLIGSERQTHGKPIGVRTSVLICLGTYTMVAAGLATTTDMSDPTRIIGQVVTGIGFIGAGVMWTRDGSVVGLTSAASVWMLAAIGVVIGANSPILGIKLSVIAFIILICNNSVERGIGYLRSRWGMRGGQTESSNGATRTPSDSDSESDRSE